jgi:hypothetical protein
VDVMKTSVDAELDRLVEKRARTGDAEAMQMLWNGSTRRHKEAIRRRNRALWFAYFCRVAANLHAAVAADYERRAEELCEKGA